MNNRMYTSYPALLILSIVGNAAAAAEGHTDSPLLAAALFKVFGSLVIVLGLVFLCAWSAKKLQLTRLVAQPKIRVIASHQLGRREKIVLVEIDNQQLLLGVTRGGISVLHESTQQQDSAFDGDAKQVINHDNHQKKTDFSQFLDRVLNSNRTSREP